MVLHVTFSDGSNPWVSLPTDRHTIAKRWRKWMKYHPDTAQPVVMCGGWEVRPDGDDYWLRKSGEYHPGAYYNRYYKHLGHALAALERLGGERP